MAKIISLSTVIFGCILLARAEPSTSTGYSVTGDNNGFEYNSNIINGAYMIGKDGHRESTDFYSGSSNGQSLITGRKQGNLEDSLRQNSFSGFSPSSHHSTYQTYSSSTRDNLGSSSYFTNDAAQSPFESYTNSNNGDTSFEGFSQGTDQTVSDFSQFSSSKHKTPTYTRYSDNLPGASNVGSFSDVASEGSSFREFSGDAFKGHASGGYMESDQAFNREPSLFNSPTNDYSYGKHKEAIFGTGGSNKYMNDVYPLHSETRYVRGNHGSLGRDYGSPTYLSNSASSHFSTLRANSDLYNPGKLNKYNKYFGDNAANTGLNYLSKDQDTDYLFSNYGKGGKATVFKDSRPSSYSSQTYFGGPSYLNKISGTYKSKPSFISYPNNPPIGYSSMSTLHSSINGNTYVDGPMLRRYRSSSGYVPGHGSMYSGYY